MKKILASTFVMFLLAVSFASALNFNLEVTPEEQKVKPYMSAFFTAHVESTMRDGGLYVFVDGKPSHWINMGTSYLDMPLPEAKDVEIEFYPNDKPGVYEYTVYLQSFLDKSIMLSDEITLVVLTGEKVDVVSNSVDADGVSATVNMEMVSYQEEEVTVDYLIINSEGVNAAVYTMTYTIRDEDSITDVIPLTDGLTAGTYTLRVKIKDTSIEFEEKVNVKPVRMVVETKDENIDSLSQEYTISVSNEGNVPEDAYVVTSTLPTGFVTFSQQPDKCENGECEWTLALGPKESTEITYRVEYWPLFAEGLLIAVLIGGFILFGWNRVNVPSLSKKFKPGKDGSYTTVLEIKNAGKKINNVVVRDVVSPLFKVNRDFETVKPAVKHTEDGTELVWNLPAIEPGDHRIIHYSVTPVVRGHLKASRAYMRFLTEKGKKKNVQTKDVYLAA